MKTLSLKNIGLTLIIVLTAAFSTQAQSMDNINAAMKSGNAKTLASYMDGTVEITVIDTDGSYSKAQAEMVVKDFYASHQPMGYQQVHSGSSSEGSKYVIGTLTTNNGIFRTYVYAKQVGGAFLIQEIRFEEE